MGIDLTIVIPNRNRDLDTVKITLDALQPQLYRVAVATIVDYGSEITYQTHLKSLISNYEFVDLLLCPTQGQLFHKTRAINIVLRQATTTYFMVLDMDCICHPEFIKTALKQAAVGNTVNFPYGFLSEQESNKQKDFDDYKVDFIGGLTGTAIFKTSHLLALNGFDEVYHNWGAEDADMFERLERFGIKTTLYKDKTLLLHQWHSKGYRLKNSTLPYHDALEKINHEYFTLSRKLNKTKANQNHDWGQGFNLEKYKKLKEPTVFLIVNSTQEELSALCFQLVEEIMAKIISITIQEHGQVKRRKTHLKSLLGLRHPNFISLDQANQVLLELIIQTYRNKPYSYSYDNRKGIIKLIIFSGSNKEEKAGVI